MKSLLNALQDGRLIELPDTDKEKALEYLALLIEAIPDIGINSDLVETVKAKEKTTNSGMGMGVACPHIKASHEGELFCAVGWATQGIEYGSADGEKVHLVIMYYVPYSQKSAYLKEISGLSKAIHKTSGIEGIINATDIKTVRNHLLDWVGFAIDSTTPDSKARMIKLEEKHAVMSVTTSIMEPVKYKTALQLIPFSVIILNGGKHIVLAQNMELVNNLEKDAKIKESLSKYKDFELAGYRVLLRSSTNFASDRILFECLAVSLENK